MFNFYRRAAVWVHRHRAAMKNLELWRARIDGRYNSLRRKVFDVVTVPNYARIQSKNRSVGSDSVESLLALTEDRASFWRRKSIYGSGHPVSEFDIAAVQVDPKFSGLFQAKVRFSGLVVKGFLLSGDDHSENAENIVELRLGDQCLRKISVKMRRGAGDFSYTIRRATLAKFPERARISIVAPDGTLLSGFSHGSIAEVNIPYADSSIERLLAQGKTIDKKGLAPLDDNSLSQKQSDFLQLYKKLNSVFLEEFNRPVFVLYGTLLGLQREGDFIRGDDDFDIGYLSDARTVIEVKDELLSIMHRLVEVGFVVGLNFRGKPFRVSHPDFGLDVRLDNRPVFTLGDGKVWMHKQACLDLDIDDFANCETDVLRGVEVHKPRNAEQFLSAYYGAGWQVPDPTYVNDASKIDRKVRANLKKICLSTIEQLEFSDRVSEEGLSGGVDFVKLRNLGIR